MCRRHAIRARASPAQSSVRARWGVSGGAAVRSPDFKHARPVLDGVLVARGQEDGELRVAGLAQGADALPQLAGGRGEGQVAEQVSGQEALFLGPREHEVPAVKLEIARVGGRVRLVEGPVLRHGGRQRRRGPAWAGSRP